MVIVAGRIWRHRLAGDDEDLLEEIVGGDGCDESTT